MGLELGILTKVWGFRLQGSSFSRLTDLVRRENEVSVTKQMSCVMADRSGQPDT